MPTDLLLLSKSVISDLLIDQLHFEGLIFTDALDMQGVAKNFSPGEIELEALKAGNDILLLPQDLEKAVKVIKEEILAGKLSILAVEEKVLKILKSKYQLGLSGKPVVGSVSSIGLEVMDKKLIALKSKLYEKAITLVQDDKKLIPIIDISPNRIASVCIGVEKVTPLQEKLIKFGIDENKQLSSTFSNETKLDIIKSLQSYETIVISLHDMSKSPSKDFGISKEAFDFIYELNSSKNVILLINGSPYALKYFPNVSTILVSYEEDPLMQEALAQAILGVTRIEGKLPVTAHEKFKVKSGLNRSGIQRLGYAIPESVGMLSDSLLAIDTIIEEMIDKKGAPGCQILAAKNGKIFFHKSYGFHTYDKKKKVRNEDLYDVASVTKTLATTISLMKLHDENELSLHKSLRHYLEELDTTNKANLIVEDVLAHHSGLPGWIPFYTETMDKESKKATRLDEYYREEPSDSFSIRITEDLFLRSDYIDSIYSMIYNCELKPNRDYRYSDLGYYIFKKIIENKSEMSLDQYVENNFYRPMGLNRTMFNPIDKFSIDNIIPSEKDDYFRCCVVQGHVHDMGAAMLGGVCGHAGLFSNAKEMAMLMQMLINGGSYAGKHFLKPETIQKFTRRYYRSSRRGLGFDMKELDENKVLNMAEEASELTFGHLGFTGISVFADPKHDLIFIFLSNRTFPSMKNTVFSKNNYRPRVQAIFYKALMNQNYN